MVCNHRNQKGYVRMDTDFVEDELHRKYFWPFKFLSAGNWAVNTIF